jgi:hypothetical protein
MIGGAGISARCIRLANDDPTLSIALQFLRPEVLHEGVSVGGEDQDATGAEAIREGFGPRLLSWNREVGEHREGVDEVQFSDFWQGRQQAPEMKLGKGQMAPAPLDRSAVPVDAHIAGGKVARGVTKNPSTAAAEVEDRIRSLEAGKLCDRLVEGLLSELAALEKPLRVGGSSG